jgi:alpha-L-rhamnosidase
VAHTIDVGKGLDASIFGRARKEILSNKNVILGLAVSVVFVVCAGSLHAARAAGAPLLPLPAQALSISPSGLVAEHLRCEYLHNPRGIQTAAPRLSWSLSSSRRGARQSAYRIIVSSTEPGLSSGEGNVWDSGKISSGDSIGIEYKGATLASGETCYWKVQTWDESGKSAPGLNTALWQMGLLNPSDWKAKWISADTPLNTQVDGDTLPPLPYFRRAFDISKKIMSATAFVTARGAYEMHLNGQKVGDAYLAPGWTDFNKRIDYQTFDITDSLHQGKNVVGAILADGWYDGYIGFSHQRNLYGERPRLLLQINIEYADGSHEVIGTDGSWKESLGPILYSDLLQGEAYDSRKELTGWDLPNYDSANWQPASTSLVEPNAHKVDITSQLRSLVNNSTLTVAASNAIAGDPAYNTIKQLTIQYSIDGVEYSQTVPEQQVLHIPGPGESSGDLKILHAYYGAPDQTLGNPVLEGAQGPPVVLTQYVPTEKVSEPTPGNYIFDLGQNMVGWAQLEVHAPAGTRIQMRYGEVLNPDGTLYTKNLRTARATDVYVCNGHGDEVWHPRFTFHGFRYVELTGYPGKPAAEMITGCVVGSAITPTGEFTCSSPLVNQIQHNIIWGQRGNFLSIPTDCPQRDERLGWMGDAQIFSRTATYNCDVAGFYEKWLVDLADGAPAWGDAGIIVPYNTWQAYGDKSLIERQWQSMVAWLDYITSVNPNGLWLQRRNNDFGDWLSINADTPKEVLATAYYAHDAQLMAQMATAIGRTDDAQRYSALFDHIKSAFDTAYVQADGTVHGNTQTSYILALHFDLLPDDLKAAATQHLVDAIHTANDHLSTGFVGVGYLCPTLTDNGQNDIAYKLLLNDTFPSWGFSVRMGATTIWERWDGYTPEHGFQDPGMNSFNHYSLGSVGEWLYRYVAGIDTDPDQPGFAHILMHPHPGPGLTHAAATFDSIRGAISSAWAVGGGTFKWTLSIPANTTATVWVPTDDVSSVTESGISASAAVGVKLLNSETGVNEYEIGAGAYKFQAKYAQ